MNLNLHHSSNNYNCCYCIISSRSVLATSDLESLPVWQALLEINITLSDPPEIIVFTSKEFEDNLEPEIGRKW